MRLHGTGAVEIPGYGTGDAEAQVEKELARALPGAVVEIREIDRVDSHGRIVETFRIAYRVRIERELEARDEPSAVRQLLRSVRAATIGTRFHRIAWERPQRGGR